MKRNRNRAFIGVLFFLLAAVYPVFSESGIYDRIGIIAEHGMHGAVPEENIDLFSGNLTLRFRDIRLPGPNGFDAVVWRVYNSKIMRDRLPGGVWGMQQEPYSWVGLGWTMHMGRVHNFDSNEPVIEFPDGRWETAYPRIIGSDYITRGFLKYDKDNYKLYFKDGTVWTFGLEKTVQHVGSNEQVRVVTRIENSYGHAIIIEYQSGSRPELKKITDSMGRTINFVLSNNRLTRIYIKNATNGTVNYYYTVGTFSQGGYTKLTQYNPPELESADYEYDSGQYDRYELTAVDTPYGGRMEYEYVDQTFYYNVQPLDTRVVEKKRIRFTSTGSFSTWNYTYPDYNNAAEGTAVVDGPIFDTNVTYHAYTGASPWQIGLLKKKWFSDGSYSQAHEWTSREISTTHWWVLNTDMGTIKAPLTRSVFTTRAGDSESKEEYWYERGLMAYGLPTKINYYAGTDGTTLRNYKTIAYKFENNSTFSNKYMLSYVSNETVYDSDNDKQKETQTDYYSSSGKYGAVDFIKRWRVGNTYLTWDYGYSSSNPNLITITINLPGSGGIETYEYRYGTLSEILRPGYTELSRTISQYNSAIRWETNQHGGVMGFSYDDLSRVTSIDMPTGFNDIGVAWADNSVVITQAGNTLTKYWDGMGRGTGYIENGDDTTLYYRKSLDDEGRVISESKGSSSSSHTYGYLLNAAGNPTRITDPRGKITNISYSGDQKTVTDAENKITIFYYEGLPGLPTKLKDPAGRYADYTLDATGRLTNVKYHNTLPHTYSYNGLDQVVSESHPETGSISYTYNTENNLYRKRWDAKDTYYTYNSSNQLTRLNPGDEIIDYGYDTRGRVLDVSGSYGWSRDQIYYNSLGSVTNERQYIPGLGYKTLSYDYSGNNNLNYVGYPDGKTLDIVNNGLNMPETVDFDGNSLVSDMEYSIAKQPGSIVISGNDTVWAATYNGVGLMTANSLKKGTVYRYRANYGHDDVGNVTSVTNAVPGLNAGFGYDSLYRLTSASYTGGKSYGYTYDNYGNLKTAKENGSTIFNRSHTTKNRINSTSYGYDGRGNMTKAPGVSYAWDRQNRLSSVQLDTGETVATGMYNERGLRLKASRVPAAAITIITPAAGQVVNKDAQLSITWSKAGIFDDYVKISLYQGDVLFLALTGSTENDGLYDWVLPVTIPDGEYTIRVQTVDDKVTGASEPFSVFGILTINPFTEVGSGAIVSETGDSSGASWGDYDSDGFLDLFTANYNQRNFLYRNNGNDTFTKITSGTVVTEMDNSLWGSWGDYDNDGDLDLFTANYNENNALHRYQGGGTFNEITSGYIVGNGGRSKASAWVDYDNNGFLDLFTANYQAGNFLYKNNGDGTFTRISSGAIVSNSEYSEHAGWADYDNDGDPDIFVSNYDRDNSLYRNNGDGTFGKITSGAVVRDEGKSSAAAWGDYDINSNGKKENTFC